jgi:tetratricopeptide (TPR) repeat protein
LLSPGERTFVRIESLLPLLLVGFWVVSLGAAPNIYRASSLYRQKKYEKLLTLLADLGNGPPRLFLYRAEALANLDRRAEAVEAYRAMIAKFPDHRESFGARRKLLTLLEQDKNYPALLDAIREFREGDSQGRLPYNRLEADALYKVGHHEEAIALLMESDEDSDQRTLAEILRELGRQKSFLKKHPVPPDDFLAQRRRGLLLEHLQRPQEAVEHYRLALKRRPDNRFCLERLATAALAGGEDSEALERYQRLVELFPGELKYGAQLGKLYWKVGKLEEAREAWRQLMRVESLDVQRAKLVVRLFLEFQDPLRALEQILEARRILGKRRILLEEEEQAHLMNRDPKAAVAVWIPLLVQVPAPQGQDVDPREEILELAGGGGRSFAAALEALEDATTLYPSFVEYYLLTDTLLRRAGREKAVPELMQRLVKAVADTPEKLYDHAEQFRDQGLALEASILFLAARERLPKEETWVVSLRAAEVLRDLGKANQASELLTPFLSAEAGTLPPGLQEDAVDLQGRILLEDLGANAEARQHFSTWIPRLASDSFRIVPWVILAARGAAAMGDLEAAKVALETLQKRGGNKRYAGEIQYRLGLLELYAGHIEKARQILRKVGEAFPETEVANDSIAEVAFLLDHKGAGEEALRRFLGLRHLIDARRFEDFHKALGDLELATIPSELRDDYLWLESRRLQAQEGDPKEIVALLRRGADEEEEGPLVPRFLWALAEAYERQGQKDQAGAVWQEYLLRHSESLQLEEVRTRLAVLKR